MSSFYRDSPPSKFTFQQHLGASYHSKLSKLVVILQLCSPFFQTILQAHAAFVQIASSATSHVTSCYQLYFIPHTFFMCCKRHTVSQPKFKRLHMSCAANSALLHPHDMLTRHFFQLLSRGLFSVHTCICGEQQSSLAWKCPMSAASGLGVCNCVSAQDSDVHCWIRSS